MAKSSTKMTAEHKAALAKGRAQAKAVRDYLQMLERDGRRSSQLSPDQLEEKIHQVEANIQEEPDPATRLELIQKRLNHQEQLKTSDDARDPEEIEKAFVDAAKAYSERKGISYSAWREIGVPAATLREAGVPRTRKTKQLRRTRLRRGLLPAKAKAHRSLGLHFVDGDDLEDPDAVRDSAAVS